MLLSNVKRVHCIGIGGIGVSALAELLYIRGYAVSGSDVVLNDNAKRIQSLGVTVYDSHAAANIENTDLVVYSSAIDDNNVELLAARYQGILCVRRGMLLAEIFNSTRGIAVAGTHGKTTTTSILADVLINAKQDPSYILGGVLQGQHSPIRVGGSDICVIESDESDGSFLHLRPKIAIVTNIDKDHLGSYNNDYAELLAAFVRFLNNLPAEGVAIVNSDDPGVKAILPKLRCRVITFGFNASADIRALAYKQQAYVSCFTISFRGKKPIPFALNMPGAYNISNALAACAVADFMRLSGNDLQCSLKAFPGVRRRFQYHGPHTIAQQRVHLVEDYGHHPAALQLSIATAKSVWPQQRCVVVFQPHRYSRTFQLRDELIEALGLADEIVLMDIYAASEKDAYNYNGYDFFQQLCTQAIVPVRFVDHTLNLLGELQKIVANDDVVLFQGAGDVGAYAKRIALTSTRIASSHL